MATSSGTRSITAHAPWVNLVTAITTVTRPVATAPPPLMSNPVRQPGSWSRRWRRAMPACDSVKLVNTPMA